MTLARRLLAFAQSQEQNIENLTQAACKRLFMLETRDIITPAREQEESVRCALNVQAMIRSLGPQAAARADFARGVQHRPSSHLSHAGDIVFRTHLPKQELVKGGRTNGQLKV